MKIRPVGVELFHADARTGMTKLIVLFAFLVNTRKLAVGTWPPLRSLPLAVHQSPPPPSYTVSCGLIIFCALDSLSLVEVIHTRAFQPLELTIGWLNSDLQLWSLLMTCLSTTVVALLVHISEAANINITLWPRVTGFGFADRNVLRLNLVCTAWF
jgi:hypothetical protein